MKKVYFLDTETTGIVVSNGEHMVELALVEMTDGLFTGDKLYRFCPNKPIEIGAQNIHQLSIFDLMDYPAFNLNSANEIRNLLHDQTIVIHNATFDIGVLNAAFKSVDQVFYVENDVGNVTNKIIDTLKVARQQFKNGNSLDALCDRFGIDRNKRVYHGALIDCYLLGEVFLKLLPNFFTDDDSGSFSNMTNEEFILDCDFEQLVRVD